MNVGMIGLGAMGAPIARNLARKNLLAGVWNRTPARAMALAQELGVHSEESAESLAAAVDIVLICVSADADVLEVVETIRSALRPGSVVIDLSTVSIDTARTCAHIVASASSDFLDAPVTGGVEGAVAATLSVMVGGSKTALDRGRPALEAIGRRIVHMGGTGMGQAAKAVNQVMVAGINQAVTEALGFGASLDLDLNKLIEVIGNGAAGNWFLDRRGSSMVQGTFAPGFKMSLHAKDLRICRDIAEGIGLTLHQVNATLDDYAVLLEEGHGDEDISALYRLKRPNR